MDKEKIKIIGKSTEGKVVDLTDVATSLIEMANELSQADEVLEREVTAYGNSGHIPIPSKHIGKRAKIIIKKMEESQ